MLIYLDNGFTSHQMRSTANCDSTALIVLNRPAAFDHLAKIIKATRAIGVCEDNVLPSHVPHAMCDRPTLSTILFQCYDTDAAMRYVCRMRHFRVSIFRPWSRRRHWMVAELVLLREVQSLVDGRVLAAVAYNQYLPALLFPCALLAIMRTAVLFLQKVDSLLQHVFQSLFFVVCGNHDAHEELRFLNGHLWWHDDLGARLLRGFLLRSLFLRGPSVQPAW